MKKERVEDIKTQDRWNTSDRQFPGVIKQKLLNLNSVLYF